MKTQNIQQFSSFKNRSYISQTHQSMHLAIFPIQIIFRKEFNDSSAYYFQKKYQILGRINKEITSQTKGASLKLRQIDNLIHFRLFSEDNDTYHWSLYRLQYANQQEYIETCGVSFRQLINKFFYAQKSQSSAPSQSVRRIFEIQQTNILFNKSGIQLNLELFVADDPQRIRQYVLRRFCNLPLISAGPKIYQDEIFIKKTRKLSTNVVATNLIAENKTQEVKAEAKPQEDALQVPAQKDQMISTGLNFTEKNSKSIEPEAVIQPQNENLGVISEHIDENKVPQSDQIPVKQVEPQNQPQVEVQNKNQNANKPQKVYQRVKNFDHNAVSRQVIQASRQTKQIVQTKEEPSSLKKALMLLAFGLILVLFGAAITRDTKRKSHRR